MEFLYDHQQRKKRVWEVGNNEGNMIVEKEKVYIEGIGWVRKMTRRELNDYIYRVSFARDCKNPGMTLNPEQWMWYHFN